MKLQHIFKPVGKRAKEEKMMTHGRAERSDGEVSEAWGVESKTLPLGQEARRERMMPWAALEGRRRGSGSNCPVASIFSFPLKLKFTL